MTGPDWASVVADADVIVPESASPDASARVSQVVQLLDQDRTSSDAVLLLRLRLAASEGALHDRLAAIDGWYLERLRGAQKYPPRSIAVAVLSFLFAAVGPLQAFPSIRTSSDYFMDLEPAALISGALSTIAAAWFVLGEAARIPFAGTRTRLYGPVVFVIFFAWLAFAILTTLVRVNDEGLGYGAVPVGIALQFLAAALYLTAFLLALRNRARIRSAPTVATTAIAGGDDVDHALRGRMDDALEAGVGTDLDRGAAAEGLRRLFELGAVSPQRARRALRALML